MLKRKRAFALASPEQGLAHFQRLNGKFQIIVWAGRTSAEMKDGETRDRDKQIVGNVVPQNSNADARNNVARFSALPVRKLST